MAAVGDQIIIESEKVGLPTRKGVILEIVPHDGHTEFRVRWEDGHVSEIRPTPSSYKITEPDAKVRT